MNCSHCGKPVPAGELVLLNDAPMHADPCFGKALKKQLGLSLPADFVLDIRKLSAEAAYRLGQESSELIFGPRPYETPPRTKKKRAK